MRSPRWSPGRARTADPSPSAGGDDLSGAMDVGTPAGGNHPKVQGAVDTIIETARRHGKTVMFSTRDPKLAAALGAKGVQILHVGSDVLAAVTYQTKLVSQVKAEVGA